MPKLLVVADDLTGATDVAGQLARSGVSSFIPLRGLEGAERFEAVAVSTESRHLPPAEAARRAHDAATDARRRGAAWIYKKTDSTLRGNIGAELEAVMAAAGADRIAFVPAFPRLGRTTRQGVHHVQGRPLGETAFAADPLNPARESRVAAALAAQTKLPIHTVDLSRMRAGAVELAERGIYVFDAEADEDLSRIARLLIEQDHRLIAGSAGLIERLAPLLPLARQAPPIPAYPARMLVLNGSVHEVSLAQTNRACAAGFARWIVPPERLIPGGASWPELPQLWPPSARHLILQTCDPAAPRACMEKGAELGLASRQISALVAANFARIARRILAAAKTPPLLVVFGGDTLQSLAREMGWAGLAPLEEIVDGMAVSRISGQTCGFVAAKPGGFGDANALLSLEAILNSRFGSPQKR